MKSVHNPAHLLAIFALAIFLSGCSNSGSNDKKPVAAAGSQVAADNGHAHDHNEADHAQGAHDHGEGDHDSHDPGGKHEGPHGGHVIELGHNHQYHAELVENEDAGTVTIYILDKEMKELAIDQKAITMNLMVDGKARSFELPAAGPVEGMTSQFHAANKALFAALHKHETRGKLRVAIDGTPYSGEVEHHHDEHDH